MTLVVELPPQIESHVREVAQAEGVEVSVLISEAAQAYVRQHDPARPLTESELLMRINRTGFPETFWDRFRILVSKRTSGVLTPEEQQELLWHTEQTENHDALRLPYLFQLAERRGVTVQALMTQLGLSPVPFD